MKENTFSLYFIIRKLNACLLPELKLFIKSKSSLSIFKLLSLKYVLITNFRQDNQYFGLIICKFYTQLFELNFLNNIEIIEIMNKILIFIKKHKLFIPVVILIFTSLVYFSVFKGEDIYTSGKKKFKMPADTLLSKNYAEKLIINDALKNILFIQDKMHNWVNIFDIVLLNMNNIRIKNSESDGDIITDISQLRKPKFSFRRGNIDAIVEKFGDLIIEHCNSYNLDWRLILAIIHQESYFDSNAVSRAGAFGLMQIMPRTGLGLQSQLQLEDTRTPKNNLIAGMYYYASLVGSFEQFGDDKYKFALMAYNAGLSRVIDVMTIASHYGKDYKKWEEIKEYLPMLSSAYDTVHSQVWKNSKRPTGGILNNWKEPYKYVEYISIYWEEYKKILPPNLREEKKIAKRKRKK